MLSPTEDFYLEIGGKDEKLNHEKRKLIDDQLPIMLPHEVMHTYYTQHFGPFLNFRKCYLHLMENQNG